MGTVFRRWGSPSTNGRGNREGGLTRQVDGEREFDGKHIVATTCHDPKESTKVDPDNLKDVQ